MGKKGEHKYTVEELTEIAKGYNSRAEFRRKE